MPEKQPGYIIILGGGKTFEDAEKTFYRFNNRNFPFECSDSFPRIFLSDSIEGLNPGFQVCVLGFCREKSTAEQLRDLVNITSEETAYIKKVNHYMGYLDCPEIPSIQADYSGYTHVFSGPVRDKISSVRWSLYSQSEYFKEVDCEVVSYILIVKQGNVIIDSEEFDEICFEPAQAEEENIEEYQEEGYPEGVVAGNIEGDSAGFAQGELEGYGIEEEYPEEVYYEDLGERLIFEIKKFKLAERTFILVNSSHAAFDEITYEDKLYGFVDGKIKKVADIFTGAEYTAPHVTYEFIPEFSPDDWRKIAILETVQYEQQSQKVFQWNDDTREFEVVAPGDPAEIEP